MTLFAALIPGVSRPALPDSAYDDIEDNLSGGAPLASWTHNDSSGTQLTDRKAGARHGTISGTVSLGATGLTSNAGTAIDYLGTGQAEVPDDAGLQLAALTISLFVKINAIPPEGEEDVVFSKDLGGLNDGDFSLKLTEDSDLIAQFQDASTQHEIAAQIGTGKVYHIAVTADGSGFEYWLNGSYIGQNASFTTAWTNNTNAIQFGSAPWTATQIEAVVHRVGLYNRVLTDAEIIELSKVTAEPAAANDTALATEEQTTVLNVVGNDKFVGRKSDLTVEILSQPTHGTVSVRGDNDIDFVADAVTQDEADSFTYRITDANGTSGDATVSVTVEDSTSAGGGTLVYEWAPLGTWITDDGTPTGNFIALANRDADFVTTLARWTDSSAATVGSLLPKSIPLDSGRRDFCFNFAPTDEPSIEVHSETNENGAMNFAVQLYDHLGGGAGPWPRHLRVVMELKTCKSTDSSTHKSEGLGTQSGTYPDWKDTHSSGNNTATKYFIGNYAGVQPGGGGNVCWWNDNTLDIDRAGYRMTSGSGSKTLKAYPYNFDRPNANAGGQDNLAGVATIDDAGVHGVWHRIEVETFLTTPSLAEDADARRTDPEQEPDHIGDGFFRAYLTKDIDGELGAPGERELVAEAINLIFFPWRDDMPENIDNLHTDANLGGPWFSLLYGGGTPAQAEGWAWIRKVQVYRHD